MAGICAVALLFYQNAVSEILIVILSSGDR